MRVITIEEHWTTEAIAPATPDEGRVTLLDPGDSLVSRIGRRPVAFGERDRWCAAASRILEAGPSETPPVATVDPSDGFGIDR